MCDLTARLTDIKHSHALFRAHSASSVTYLMRLTALQNNEP